MNRRKLAANILATIVILTLVPQSFQYMVSMCRLDPFRRTNANILGTNLIQSFESELKQCIADARHNSSMNLDDVQCCSCDELMCAENCVIQKLNFVCRKLLYIIILL